MGNGGVNFWRGVQGLFLKIATINFPRVTSFGR